MSFKAMSEYTRYAKYAKYLPEKKRREDWHEQVKRVMDMHRQKYGDKLNPIKDKIDWLEQKIKDKYLVGSQRALQFGGEPILKREAKIYNCTASYADRVKFFPEAFYLLLCGAGTGFSVQFNHVKKLPRVEPRSDEKLVFKIPDSIEGWSDALALLVNSYFAKDTKHKVFDTGEVIEARGKKIVFDFSLIRPEGSPLSWGGVAPGYKGLESSLTKIEMMLEKLVDKGPITLRPINVYDIVMYASDAALSGGVRRSATICLFSKDDEEMKRAKTGDWFLTNPQRGRSNNSALLVRNELTPAEFHSFIESTKQFGEPGFVFADDEDFLVNPCVEVALYAKDEDGKSGWQFCNLCEINMKKCRTKEEFFEACEAAAILGTLQAGYDNIGYLSKTTEKIVKREALLGISMTGMMDNPEIAFNPEIQKQGAKIILEVNEKIAKIIGINKAARATCVKPAGTTSLLMGTASGVHPHHAKLYFRRIQANKLEFPAQFFKSINPLSVEESVWSTNKTDLIVTFCCEINDGAKTKNQVDALTLLEHVKLTQQNWVSAGTRLESCVKPWLKHNVSNTINIKDDEWDDVEKFIFKNKKYFTGISMLSINGDKDYPQAPFCTVYTPIETVKEYGDGSLMASGLIVDGMKAFDNNLWAACDCVLGIGEKLDWIKEPRVPKHPVLELYPDPASYAEALEIYAENYRQYSIELDSFKQNSLKVDWVRRAKQFALRYFENDLRKMTYCLKDVHNWKLWCDLRRETKDVNWNDAREDDYKVEVAMMGGDACAGGKCEVGDLGAAIAASKQQN